MGRRQLLTLQIPNTRKGHHVPSIEVRDNRVWVDDEPVDLIGGEVHYWRLMPENWGPVLDAVKDLGIEVIATYVQWQFHEYAEGEFDFDGRTHSARNLVGFLRAAADRRIKVLIRPGPYTYTEWINEGIPQYVARFHRLHPDFLAAARRYIHAVTEALAPFFATNGGPIILLQPDNQIETGDVLYGNQLGLGGGDGLFQEFLRDRYTSVDELNAAWGTSYDDIASAKATVGQIHEGTAERRRFLDFLAFRQWYTLRYAKWLIETFTEAGVTVPFYLNTYVDLQDQDPRSFSQLAPLVGYDPYPSNEFRETAGEHRHYLEMARYFSATTAVPYIAEYQCGTWHGKIHLKGVYTPNHYRLSALTMLLGGAVGWNWYMLVNRDNWYQSPINEWGQQRLELSHVFREVVQGFKDADIPATGRVSRTGAFFSFEQHASRMIDDSEPVLRALYEAGIDYHACDSAGDWNVDLLFYSGLEWLDEPAQHRLRSYVEAGGRLVLFQAYPRQNPDGTALNVLGIAEEDQVRGQGYVGNFQTDLWVHLEEYDGHVPAPRNLGLYSDPPGKPITATRFRGFSLDDRGSQEHEYLRSLVYDQELTVGYRLPLGAGEILKFGIPPSGSLIRAIHDVYGVKAPAATVDPGPVTVGLRSHPDGSFLLIAVNNGEEARDVRIRLAPHVWAGGDLVVEDLLGRQASTTALAADGELVVSVGRKDGALLRLRADA